MDLFYLVIMAGFFVLALLYIAGLVSLQRGDDE